MRKPRAFLKNPMQILNDIVLIEKLKRKWDIETDSGLARRLKLSRATVSLWRKYGLSKEYSAFILKELQLT